MSIRNEAEKKRSGKQMNKKKFMENWENMRHDKQIRKNEEEEGTKIWKLIRQIVYYRLSNFRLFRMIVKDKFFKRGWRKQSKSIEL